MSGTLFVVATPIGNLQDITLRAIETLKSVDMIACEDTRHSGILLAAHGITTPTTSYHSHTSESKSSRLIDALKEGRSIALISDAGLPGISDPGWPLVRATIDAGIAVTVVPGASASLAALVLSGFPTDRFIFEGFLPIKPGARRTRLALLKEEERSTVVYESPYRILKLLGEIEEVLGDIRVSVSRELTKKFEETRRGTASQLREHFEKHSPRGEFVVVIPPVRERSSDEH